MGDESILSEFFHHIWREEKGFVYLALKDPSKDKKDPRFWTQVFFEWPTDASQIVDTVISKRSSYDVYYAPAIFNTQVAKKEHVRGAHAFWIEFDGKNPANLENLPEPSIVIQSSNETHKHYYWSTESLVERETLESINRSLAYKLGADTSGWDSTQVLRPPGTINHGKVKTTKLLSLTESRVSSVAFQEILPKNIPAPIQLPTEVPEVSDVLAKYKFNQDVWSLFKEGVKVDRSAGLMKLGYFLAELNLPDPEIFSLLANADMRWGKFAKRQDRDQRLLDLILHARLKYPFKSELQDTSIIQLVDVVSFLESEIKLEWVWQDLLQKNGYFLLTGPTGTGKTQVSLNFAANAALGLSFLERDIISQQRVAFISLEMNDAELQFFLKQQMSIYTDEQRAVLAKNLLLLPIGYPIYLNRDNNREAVEEMIDKYELDGIIFDSLGSMTSDELSKESTVKEIMDWNDSLRNKFNVFTWIIHHHRKAQGQNKRPNKIDDVYGSHYVTARATSVIGLWAGTGTKTNTVEVLPLKIRLAAKPPAFAITRDGNLNFSVNKGITIQQDEDEEIDIADKSDEVSDLGDKF